MPSCTVKAGCTAVARSTSSATDSYLVSISADSTLVSSSCSPLLPARQTWRLVDNDTALLETAAETTPATCEVTTAHIDLADDLGRAIADDSDFVTTSALLDLISADWLARLVAILSISRRPLYAALSFDGRVDLTPACRDDAAVIAAVNRHQLTDKGFGPALGPQGGAAAAAALEAEGFAVAQGGSDWVFGPADQAIQLDMFSGWVGAANRVARGGGFTDAAVNARSARRGYYAPTSAPISLGARPAAKASRSAGRCPACRSPF